MTLAELKYELSDVEASLLSELRNARQSQRVATVDDEDDGTTFGQRFADRVANIMGSWPFIIIQSLLLALWIGLNITAYVKRWDPYPFILLNLALSFQAAYAAPFIMMSQNRKQAIDRRQADDDYRVNVKAELEIELLHQKIDALREKEVLALASAIHKLTIQLQKREP